MNRQQRRANEAAARKTGTDKPFKAQDEATTEAHVFAAQLQDVVHKVIADAGYNDPSVRAEKAPLVVNGLGLTAAAFAMAAGCNEGQFVEAMTVYYRQVSQQLQEAFKAAKQAEPKIIVPPSGS